MPCTQYGDTMLQICQAGAVIFSDLIQRGLNGVQLALQIAERALIMLIRRMRGVPLLFEVLNVSLSLSEFMCPRCRLLARTLVRL